MLLKEFPDKTTFCRMAETANVIPVCAEVLADTETPVSLLSKFRSGGKPMFLLESVEGGERWGRYSFLGVSARSQIRVYKDTVRVETQGVQEEIAHHQSPLNVLKEFMAAFRPAQVPGLPRFWGGLVGYLSYEMVSFFEAIPNRMPPERPLAHFIVPDELLIIDNIRHTLLIVTLVFTKDCEAGGAGVEELYHFAQVRIGDMLNVMSQNPSEPEENGDAGGYSLSTPLDPETFRSHVRRIKEYIQAGDVIQTVLSQLFVCHNPPDLLSLYRAQRYINPSPYLFFMKLAETALVGSSPETMVRLENGVATLRPIAGTRPRGKTEQKDRALADELLQDEKERAEHLMLVDLGRNDLGRVAVTGTVQVTDLMIVERYSHVMHLVSNICCDVEADYDAWELLRATFPAGTLSGAPKVRAMEIIAELEAEPRGPYGGAVGYISFSGNMDMAITIRTACISDGQLTVRAGAGIVADSDPEKERMETVNKAKAIEKALQLITQGHT